ncbi:MAG TPA: hypothetical protein DDW52_09455 [Planctomycetaceae bacterium]|nr:hypothetical protein [Planctomycetaceae bacterium]
MTMTKRKIITVVNAASPVSIEFYEFGCERSQSQPNEDNVLIVLDVVSPDFSKEFQTRAFESGLRTYECDGSYWALWRSLRNELVECRSALIHVHMGRSGVAAQLIGLMHSPFSPRVYTLHTMFKEYRLVHKVLSVANVALARCTVFVSSSARDAFPTLLRKIAGRCRVISNGVKFAETRVTQSRKKRFLLNVGRLVPAKNQAWLVQLMTELPDYSLHIVGDGELRNELESLAGKIGVVDRIHFWGMVSRQRVRDLMEEASIFVSSSVREGMPVAVLEALSVGLPVVLSDIAPHQEIANLISGVQISKARKQAWVDGIASIDGLERSGYDQLSMSLKRATSEHFSIDSTYRRYTNLYNELLGL